MARFSSLLASAACVVVPLVALVVPGLTEPTQIATITGTQGLENIAVRSSGELLVTSTTSNLIFMVFPDGGRDPVAVAELDSSFNATLGIAELTRDVFYVIGAQVNGLTMISGSAGIWKVDLRPMTLQGGAVSQPADVSLLTAIPSAQLLNGLCRLAENDTEHILISDSVAGSISRLNVETLEYETVISDETMRVTTSSIAIGIDGIRIFQNTLYFTNINQALFASVPISLVDGTATGPIEVIADLSQGDDFAITPDGQKAIVAQNGLMTLASIDLSSGSVQVIANSTLLSATSSLAFGRRCADSKSIYVSGSASMGDTTVGSVLKLEL
ncbi:hypothetical protein F4821DRAFT_239865 [Hypoxylon rubiginosum]|uniref:Uncharacterized protein n=1 Tax=Hypoxylon rubiginosum TaxID=110542 RepID=A0ACC0CZF0_9PEZI|nr:hypothetical protein F4821DRAFT_239865 [Hypoxylon rubiginosum]